RTGGHLRGAVRAPGRRRPQPAGRAAGGVAAGGGDRPRRGRARRVPRGRGRRPGDHRGPRGPARGGVARTVGADVVPRGRLPPGHRGGRGAPRPGGGRMRDALRMEAVRVGTVRSTYVLTGTAVLLGAVL